MNITIIIIIGIFTGLCVAYTISLKVYFRYCWYTEGYNYAMQVYEITGEMSILKSFEPGLRVDYVNSYTRGFNRALEKIDKESDKKD